MTTRFKISVTGLDPKVRKFSQANALFQTELNQLLRRIGKILVPAVKRETPIGATGRLRKSTVFQIVGGPKNQVLELRQSARSKNFPYHLAVRKGTKPHFPPPEALIPWVKKKWGIPNTPAYLARGAAFVLARSIAKKGTKANPYDDRAIKKTASIIRQEVRIFARRIKDGLR